MGMKYGQGKYYGTRGSIVQTYFTASTKKEAKSLIPLLPTEIQASAKDFFGHRSSNKYEGFSASTDTSGNHILVMEKPGDVPGSRAVYFKIIDKNGNSKTYKETYDPQGNFVHSKDK
jgi:hypothetical protein